MRICSDTWYRFESSEDRKKFIERAKATFGSCGNVLEIEGTYYQTADCLKVKCQIGTKSNYKLLYRTTYSPHYMSDAVLWTPSEYGKTGYTPTEVRYDEFQQYCEHDANTLKELYKELIDGERLAVRQIYIDKDRIDQNTFNSLYKGVPNMDNKTHLINQAREKALGEHRDSCIAKRKAILDASGLGKLLTKFKADVYKLNTEQQVVNEASNFDFLFDKYLTKEEFEQLNTLERERREAEMLIKQKYENILHLALQTETYEQYVELLIAYDIIKDFRKKVKNGKE